MSTYIDLYVDWRCPVFALMTLHPFYLSFIHCTPLFISRLREIGHSIDLYLFTPSPTSSQSPCVSMTLSRFDDGRSSPLWQRVDFSPLCIYVSHFRVAVIGRSTCLAIVFLSH